MSINIFHFWLIVTILFSSNVSCDERTILNIAKFAMDAVTGQCAFWNPPREWLYNNSITAEKLNILFYTGGKYEPYLLPNASGAITSHPAFKTSAKTVVFIHGFNGSPYQPVDVDIAQSMTAKGYNYLAVDGFVFMGGIDYVYIAGSIPWVSDLVFRLVSELYTKGVPRSNIYLVGESLGAQISGLAARRFFKKYNLKLPRITALEPASPCFMKPGITSISKDDADYVDVIFTSSFSVIFEEVGHAQYFVNNRHRLQPGCFLFPVLCSHMRAKDLFAESVKNEQAFPAKKCSDIITYTCNPAEVSFAGIASNPSTRGNYFFKTTSSKPYSMGYGGIQ